MGTARHHLLHVFLPRMPLIVPMQEVLQMLLGAVFILLPAVLMLVAGWSALRTGLALLVFALLSSLTVRGMETLPYLLEGAVKGLKVSLIAFAAYVFYLAYREAGYAENLQTRLRGKGLERAVLAVYLGGFLEAVSGYGVPAAVIAPLLASMGLSETRALSVALLGHSWAVPFASLGVPTLALSMVTDVDHATLSTSTALLLSLPFATITYLAAAMSGVPRSRSVALAALSAALGVVGASMAGYSALFAGSIGLLAMLAVTGRLGAARSLTPYIVLALLLTLIALLGAAAIEAQVAVVLLSSLVVMLPKGRLGLGAERGGLLLLMPALRTIVTLTILSAAAVLAGKSGLLTSLATRLAGLGPIYPTLAPLIGFLGAYVSGSCTTSNLLFGLLQAEFAREAGVNALLLLSLHNAGGGIGSVASPAKVATGASTVRGAREGEAARETFRVVLPPVLVLCLEGALLSLAPFGPLWARDPP